MKIEALKKQLDRNRPMKTISIRIPEDAIEDLKRIAPLLGFSGYQPLARTYIGQDLRADLERLEGDTVSALIASLKRHVQISRRVGKHRQGIKFGLLGVF